MRNSPSLAQVMGKPTVQVLYRNLTCEGAATPYVGSAAMATALRKKYPAGCASILIGAMPSAAYGKAPGSQARAAIHLGLDMVSVGQMKMGGINGPDMQNLRKALAINGRIGIAEIVNVSLICGPGGPW